ncbi:MAG TPA: hypothetical protein VJK25_00025 [Patescibacteria group bacterium]|nr:hypothetical protein [Patescibacteria group bacterium]
MEGKVFQLTNNLTFSDGLRYFILKLVDGSRGKSFRVREDSLTEAQKKIISGGQFTASAFERTTDNMTIQFTGELVPA